MTDQFSIDDFPTLEQMTGAGTGAYDPSRNVLGPGGSLSYRGSPTNGGINTGLGFDVQTMAAPSTTFNGNTNTGVSGGATGIYGGPGADYRFDATTGTMVPNSGVSGYGTNGTPPPAPTTTAPSGGGGGKDAFGQAWLASGGRTVEDLKRFVAAHPEYGVKLGGSKGDKVYGPNGEFWADAVISAGTGGNGASWQTDTGGGGGQGNTLAGLGYGFGSAMAPWNEQFQAPNPEQIANDPYYQFQKKEGEKSYQGSAAAKGTLLTGGTLKGLMQYGQGLASSFGDKAYDRGMGEYLLRRDNFYNNQDRPWNKNLSLAQLGRPQ